MSIIWGFFCYFLFLHSLCRDRGRFCLCQGTAEQESPGGKEPTGDQEIITQVLQSRVQLARPRDAEEQVVNETKWWNMMVGEILFRTWHEMCLTESHWTRGCTRETWKQPSCCHCWTTKRGQQGRLVRVCIGFASCLSIAFDSVFDERLYFYPGVAKARVVVDENTDPASLNLSNCSVDGTKLGKMFPNLLNFFCLQQPTFFLRILYLATFHAESIVPLINFLLRRPRYNLVRKGHRKKGFSKSYTTSKGGKDTEENNRRWRWRLWAQTDRRLYVNPLIQLSSKRYKKKFSLWVKCIFYFS